MLKTVRGCHHPRESCVGRYSLGSSAVIEASPRDMYANYRPELQKFGLSEASLAELRCTACRSCVQNTSEVFASAVGVTGTAGHDEGFSKMAEEEEEKKSLFSTNGCSAATSPSGTKYLILLLLAPGPPIDASLLSSREADCILIGKIV